MKLLLEQVLGERYNKLASFIDDNGKRWFKAQDVCKVLGLKNTSIAVKGNKVKIGYFGIDHQDIHKFSPYKSSMLFISEAGVYKLILKSRKPAAYQIKVQLSELVLPALMKQGSFIENPVQEGSTE